MAFTPGNDPTGEHAKQRKMYIEELEKKGIENEFTEPLDEKKTVFIKLHGTLPFLYRYCNKLSINLPLKGNIIINVI